MKFKTAANLSIGGAIIVSLFNLAWMGGLVYIAIHFIHKLW